MALSGQLLGQVPQRLGRPAQRRHRIPALIRLHQPEQGSGQLRVLVVGAPSSTAGPARSPNRQRVLPGLQLGHAPAHRGGADSRRLRDGADTAVPQQPSLRRQGESLLTFVQMRQQHLEPPGELTANLGIDGHTTSSDSTLQKNKLFLYSSTTCATCSPAYQSRRSRTWPPRSARSSTSPTPTP
jgi:hypothetical protein